MSVTQLDQLAQPIRQRVVQGFDVHAPGQAQLPSVSPGMFMRAPPSRSRQQPIVAEDLGVITPRRRRFARSRRPAGQRLDLKTRVKAATDAALLLRLQAARERSRRHRERPTIGSWLERFLLGL